MSYPDDLCASATSVFSPIGAALNPSPCALTCWQRRQVSRDQPAVRHLCAPCGSVRNAAVPWSYWNDSPRFSCAFVPLPRPSFSNHEAIFLNSNSWHRPRRSPHVCPCAHSATLTPRIPQCSLPCFIHFAPPIRLSLRIHPATLHSKRITAEGQTGGFLQTAVSKATRRTSLTAASEFRRRVTSDTALAFRAN
jgi:hypothetical protein